LTYDLEINRFLEIVEVHMQAKLYQTKRSGSRVINSALDFGQH